MADRKLLPTRPSEPKARAPGTDASDRPDERNESRTDMRHASTEQLYAYWMRQRGVRPAPLRASIEPAHIPALLGDLFILDATDFRTLPFRLAGTRLCAGLGRELTGTDFLSLWQETDYGTMAATLKTVALDAAPAVLEIAGSTERGHQLAAEMIVLPLSQDGSRRDRILGLLAPMERPHWLGLHPITRLQILGIRWFPPEAPSLPKIAPVAIAKPAPATPGRLAPDAPASPAGRRRQHLVVLDGGRD